MFVTKKAHLELDVFKWLALIALVGAISLGFAMSVWGQTGRPSDLNGWQLQDARPLMQPASATDVWLAIQYHEAGDMIVAAQTWEMLHLEAEVDVWRQVALATAYLHLSDLTAAEYTLADAMFEDPHNAVAHYYTGVLRLMQADDTPRWIDVPFTMATYRLPGIRAMYEAAAARAFEQAVALAPEVDYEQPLAEMDWGDAGDMEMPVVPPTVADLLQALGSVQYVGQSHHTLGALLIDQGALDQAEQHLDAARAEIRVHYGYRVLAQAHEAQGNYADAARAHLKGMTQGRAIIGPGARAMANLWKALAAEK